jgi:fucose 4-O-acetylase-like acetyltransferase
LTPPERLPHLDTLRGLGILFVVGMHAEGYASALKGSPFGHLWSRVAGVSVPVFFLADGYLLARSVSSSTPDRPFSAGAYLRSSARRLLVPYVVFNTIYTALRALFEAFDFFPTRLVLGRTSAEILWNVFDSRIAMQMYFLASLFLIRAVMCGLRGLVARGGVAVLTTAVGYAVALRFSGLRLGTDALTNAVYGLQYVMLGVTFFQYDREVRRHASWVAAAGLGLFAALFVLESRVAASPWLALAVQLALLSGEYALFVRLGSRPAVLGALGRQTMEIYLLHAPVLIKLLQVVGARTFADPLALFAFVWGGAC